MYHRDSPTQREMERRGVAPDLREQSMMEQESDAGSISRPGGFRNDPDVPTNPNEARERYLRKLRSLRFS
jgi:hypothetical protein